MPDLLRAIDASDPQAYYTVSDVKEHARQYRGSFKAPPQGALQSPSKRK